VDTQLLVVGAGPYGLSTAALALEHDIDTVVLGRPMDFWKTNMPAGMFLRSGLDWHLDAAGIHTLAAYLEERAIAASDVDPIPIGVFLDYAQWFRRAKRIEVREELTVDLDKRDGRFTATLENGEQLVTDAVVCAPGIRHYTTVPHWASDVPPGRAAHTCDLVRFDEMADNAS
jgi:FAD-dependent urate hydroxylase